MPGADDELGSLDAADQAALVAKGELTPLELVDAAIARIERLDPELNAVIHPLFDRARERAASSDLAAGDRAFRGVPVVVKDLDGTYAGAPNHMGCRLLKDAGHLATETSHLFAKLEAAGFVVVGKTNTPEFGLVPTTEPLAYGPSRNPWDTTRSTGGSSGGSAAAVASGMVPVGHAGDGGGSIRIPASECGLVGLKPSRGRVSMGPGEGEPWAGLVARLAVTRSVRDTAAVLDAVSGPMPGDPTVAPPPARPYTDEVGADPGRLRIGFQLAVPNGSAVLQPEVEAGVRAAAALLASLGHDVDEVRVAGLDDDGLVAHFTNCYGAWVAAEIDHVAALAGRPAEPGGFEPGTWLLYEMGKAVTGAQYVAGREYLEGATRRLAEWWPSGDEVLVTPVIPEVPPVLGSFTPTDDNPLAGLVKSTQIVPFTVPFNVSGQPAISLPLHWSESGLPVGIQFVAAYGREDLLIRLAAQLEAAQPWAHRRPPVHA